MALYIEAGWDFAVIGQFSLQFTDAGGSSTIVISTGRYAHRDLTSVMGTGEYDDFAGALQAALNADATLTGVYTVTFAQATGFYTVSIGAGTFSTANPSGTVAGRILGRTAAAAAVTSFTSTVRAYYSISTTTGGKSQVKDDYEQSGLVVGGHTMGATAYSATPSDSIVLHDFTVPMETKEKTYSRSATSADPWTFQHLFEHVRGEYPIFVDEGASPRSVHQLRAESAHFEPRREVADYDGQWNIDLRTYLIGRI